MRLASLRTGNEENLAVLVGGLCFPVSAINRAFGQTWPEKLDRLLQSGRFDEFHSWVDQNQTKFTKILEEIAVAYGTVHLAPLYRHPSKIWGIGLNYADHAQDLAEQAPQGIPASFMKSTTTIIGEGDAIRIPPQSMRTTGEAELGVVIKSKCKDVPRADWLSVVAGFTAILDMTAEDILRKNPRYLTLTKNFDTFFSFGPVLVTPDEIADVTRLHVATVINGKVHAENTVDHMTFPPDFLVSFHSEVMTLLPGDIISTGTPRATVLSHGDLLECNIEGFPPLRNPVIDLKVEKK